MVCLAVVFGLVCLLFVYKILSTNHKSKEIMDNEYEPKKKYASASQTRRLIQLLVADPELRSGKFSAHFTFKTAQKRWCEISDELNAIGGAHKTWSEWRKTYHDKKTKAKKKASAQNKSARQTGGGDPAEELNDDERLLLGSISGAQISKKSKLHKSLEVDAASDLQRALTEENVIKREYYKKKIEQMKRQADALEAIAKSIASRARASPYIKEEEEEEEQEEDSVCLEV